MNHKKELLRGLWVELSPFIGVGPVLYLRFFAV